MIEAGIVALVTADATMTGLIGNRMYPVLLPEPTVYPCLSYQVVTASSMFALDRTQIATKRFQFDAWGANYGDCKSVLVALDGLLNGYSGVLADGTRVLVAISIQELDQFESDGRVYRSIAEYSILYTRT